MAVLARCCYLLPIAVAWCGPALLALPMLAEKQKRKSREQHLAQPSTPPCPFPRPACHVYTSDAVIHPHPLAATRQRPAEISCFLGRLSALLCAFVRQSLAFPRVSKVCGGDARSHLISPPSFAAI